MASWDHEDLKSPGDKWDDSEKIKKRMRYCNENGHWKTDSSINKDSSQVDKVPSAKSLIGRYINIQKQDVYLTEHKLNWAVVDNSWIVAARFKNQEDAECFLHTKSPYYFKIVEIID